MPYIDTHTPVLAPSGRPVQKHTNTNKQICGEGVSSGIESQTASFCDDGNVVGGDGLSLSDSCLYLTGVSMPSARSPSACSQCRPRPPVIRPVIDSESQPALKVSFNRP